MSTDMFSALPPIVVERILEYLEPKDITTVMAVSKRWRHAANNQFIWKKICTKLQICPFDCRKSLPLPLNIWYNSFIQLQRNWNHFCCKHIVHRRFKLGSLLAVKRFGEEVVVYYSNNTIEVISIKNQRSIIIHSEIPGDIHPVLGKDGEFLLVGKANVCVVYTRNEKTEKFTPEKILYTTADGNLYCGKYSTFLIENVIYYKWTLKVICIADRKAWIHNVTKSKLYVVDLKRNMEIRLVDNKASVVTAGPLRQIYSGSDTAVRRLTGPRQWEVKLGGEVKDSVGSEIPGASVDILKASNTMLALSICITFNSSLLRVEDGSIVTKLDVSSSIKDMAVSHRLVVYATRTGIHAWLPHTSQDIWAISFPDCMPQYLMKKYLSVNIVMDRFLIYYCDCKNFLLVDLRSGNVLQDKTDEPILYHVDESLIISTNMDNSAIIFKIFDFYTLPELPLQLRRPKERDPGSSRWRLLHNLGHT